MNAAEITEKVARAMHGNRYEWPLPEFAKHRGEYRDLAKAAILATLDAICEPSDAMLYNDEISEITLHAARAIHSSELPCADIWRAMIDALKREITG